MAQFFCTSSPRFSEFLKKKNKLVFEFLPRTPRTLDNYKDRLGQIWPESF